MMRFTKAIRKDAQTALNIRNTAILNQCVGHYPEDIIQGWIVSELSDEFADAIERSFYLAWEGDMIVGTGMIDLDTGKIDAIFVHPGHMRRDIGRSILDYLERLAISQDLKVLTLQSTLNAAAFYHACGYKGDAVDVYISSKGMSMDCIPMTKVIAR